jgi:uncharacterized membrane protein
MTYDTYLPAPAAHPFHGALVAFPIACFSLTVLSDLAYLNTANLLWLHFSEWLLLAGLVFGGLDILVLAGSYIMRRRRILWLPIVGGIITMLLATLNSFVHTADGWTAVMPWGIALSILTVLVMIATGWLAHRRV